MQQHSDMQRQRLSSRSKLSKPSHVTICCTKQRTYIAGSVFLLRRCHAAFTLCPGFLLVDLKLKHRKTSGVSSRHHILEVFWNQSFYLGTDAFLNEILQKCRVPQMDSNPVYDQPNCSIPSTCRRTHIKTSAEGANWRWGSASWLDSPGPGPGGPRKASIEKYAIMKQWYKPD